jgi:hypothetical protein
MKAIYINLDPYLKAAADWLAAGKPGDAPKFAPIPLAVTIPLGETACIYAPGDPSGELATFQVLPPAADAVVGAIGTGSLDPTSESAIATNQTPGFSQYPAPSGGTQKYSILPVTGDVVFTVSITDADATEIISLAIPVLVRRETASGPVDVVDFTPPASAIAAGTDLKGATFDGNEIVAAAETGALSAPAGA